MYSRAWSVVVLLVLLPVAVAIPCARRHIIPPALNTFMISFQNAIESSGLKCLFYSLMAVGRDTDFRLSQTVGIGVPRSEIEGLSGTTLNASNIHQARFLSTGRFGANGRIRLDVAQFVCRCMDSDCLETRMLFMDYRERKCYGFQSLEPDSTGNCRSRWMQCGEFLAYENPVLDDLDESLIHEFKKTDKLSKRSVKRVSAANAEMENDTTQLIRPRLGRSYVHDSLDEGPIQDDNILLQGTGLKSIKQFLVEQHISSSQSVNRELMYTLSGNSSDPRSFRGRVSYRQVEETNADRARCKNILPAFNNALECGGDASKVKLAPRRYIITEEDADVECPGARNVNEREGRLRALTVTMEAIRDTILRATVDAPKGISPMEFALVWTIVLVICSGEAVSPFVALLFEFSSFPSYIYKTAKTIYDRIPPRFWPPVDCTVPKAIRIAAQVWSERLLCWKAAGAERTRRRVLRGVLVFVSLLPLLLTAMFIPLTPILASIFNEKELSEWNQMILDSFVKRNCLNSGSIFVEVYNVEIEVDMVDTFLTKLYLAMGFGIFADLYSERKAFYHLFLVSWGKQLDDNNVPILKSVTETISDYRLDYCLKFAARSNN